MEIDHSSNRATAWAIWEKAKDASPSDGLVKDLEHLLVHPYQWFRIEAAEKLGVLRATQSVPLLSAALNDRCEFVAAAAAEALAQIGTADTLEVLRCSFEDDQVERPHYLANAISKFGENGFEVLARCASSESATIRYFAAKGLGATGMRKALPILEALREHDLEKTVFGGSVSTAAKEGIKTLRRVTKHEGLLS